MQVQIFQDSLALYRAAAEEFRRQAKLAVKARGAFSVALSGGSTPRGMYAQLAEDTERRKSVPWEKIRFFWGDERAVPPDHLESNYRMAWDELLAKVPVPQCNIHRIHGEKRDASEVAEEYERTLRMRFPGDNRPRFDLVLLGLGSDGHTASLFPGSPALSEETRWVVANPVKKLGTHRITLTVPVLNNAACVLFMVSGADKAAALQEVLEGRHEPERLPAQLIRPPKGRLMWFADAAASRLLNISGGAHREAQSRIPV
ncbi:MAG: 6-phosphogluconolactonase [Burkholderiales bacterium]